MTTPTDLPAGAPCWIDLLSSDIGRSREFYTHLFGWTAGEASEEFGGYFMFFRDGEPVAGAMPGQPGVDVMDQWGIYLHVDDARKTLDLALASGAQASQPAVDIADLGTSAVITDPNGARIGIWQANTFAGFGGVRPLPGAPGWVELHTRDYDKSVAFYRAVFGWDTHTASDTPEFRYTTLGPADRANGGIMDAAGFGGGAPAGWSVYFAADDVDATLARVTELGGAVAMPAEDTPYGRLAAATDPVGAQFKLIGPNVSGDGPGPS